MFLVFSLSLSVFCLDAVCRFGLQQVYTFQDKCEAIDKSVVIAVAVVVFVFDFFVYFE